MQTRNEGQGMEDKPVAETWFSVEVHEHDILRFREHNIDSYAVGDFWLVRGRDKGLLVDCGTGIVSPCPLVTAIAAKPYTVVALNSYYDHAGAWSGFPERACHPLDAKELAHPEEEMGSVSDYLNDETLWALPHEGYQVSEFKMVPAEPTRLVEEGDIFDLGDRQLDVFHMPGRSPGGLVIWEAETGSLFTSDMMYDGNHGLAWPPSEPEAYCNSIRRMRRLPVQRVFPGHYGPFEKRRLHQIIDGQLADLEATT